MNKTLMARYREARLKETNATNEVMKLKGIVETCDPDDIMKRELVMAEVRECDAREDRLKIEKRLDGWIQKQPPLARRALKDIVFDDMTIEAACAKADPRNVNYTKELVTRLIKEIPVH